MLNDNDDDFINAMRPYFPTITRRIGKGKIKESQYMNAEIVEIYKNMKHNKNEIPAHFDSYESFLTWGS